MNNFDFGNINNIEIRDPKTDIIFKKLFRDFDTLLTFINDITDIGAVEVLGLHEQELSENDKTSRLDVSVVLSTGELVNVEMQNSRQPYYLDRALYYASRLYGFQKTDNTYTDLRKVIGIHIVNHNMEFFDNNLFSLFRMTNTTGSRIIDKMDLYFINLKATNDNKQQVKDWKELFNNYDKMEVFMNNRLQEIHDKLRDLSLTDLERAIYEQEVKAIMDANTDAAVKRMEKEESRREKEEIRREKEEIRREKEEFRREKEELRRQKELIYRAAIITIKDSMRLGKTLEDSINELELPEEIIQQILRYFNRLQN